MQDNINIILSSKIILRNKRLIAFCALVCATVSFSIYCFTSKEWYANVVLLIGKNYSITENHNSEQLIEPISIIQEKIKNRDFQNSVLNAVKITPTEDNKQAKILYDTLSTKAIQDGAAINISLKANNIEVAKQELKIITNFFINRHQILKERTEKLLLEKKNFLEKQIEMIGKENLSSLKITQPNILGLNLIQTYLQQVNILNQELFNIKIILENIQLNSTKILNDIYVAEKPIFPKRSVFILSGFIIGIILGVIIAHIKQYKNL